MCTLWDGIIPSDEFFLESMIYSNTLLDVDLVAIRSNLHLSLEFNIGTIHSFDSPIELEVGVLVEFDSIGRIFYSHDDDFVPTNSITSFNFDLPFNFDMVDCRSSGLGTIESSLVNSNLIMPIIEDIEV